MQFKKVQNTILNHSSLLLPPNNLHVEPLFCCFLLRCLDNKSVTPKGLPHESLLQSSSHCTYHHNNICTISEQCYCKRLVLVCISDNDEECHALIAEGDRLVKSSPGCRLVKALLDDEDIMGGSAEDVAGVRSYTQ